MAIPLSLNDREHRKFKDVQNDVAVKVTDIVGNSLVPSTYDYINLSYTDGNLTTVIYKIGGSAGTTVSTLTLAYDVDNNLISVEKS